MSTSSDFPPHMNEFNKYPDFPPHMNELGKFVFLRTYARYLPHEKRRETWKEVCIRASTYNINLLIKHLNKNNVDISNMMPSIRAEHMLLFENMWNLKQCLSGRTLWVGGTRAAERSPCGNFNCSFLNIKSYHDLCDLFYMLLVGTGVGFRCTPTMALELPPVRTNVKLLHSEYKAVIVRERLELSHFTTLPNGYAKIYVGDSKEGWVGALRHYFEILTNPQYEYIHTLKISYNSIRPLGDKLLTFGGTASGHQPLLEMFQGIHNTLIGTLDPSIARITTDSKGYGNCRPIHILEMGNLIGHNVVVGGVRRCIPKGSLVHCRTGMIPIENVKIGYDVLTSQGYRKVTDHFNQGNRELIRIVTEDGEFVCTENHRMPRLLSNGSFKYVEASHLKPNDLLITSRVPIEGSDTRLPIPQPQMNTPIPQPQMNTPELDCDMAWFMGTVFNNEYITSTVFDTLQYLVHSKQKDVCNKIKSQIQRFSNTLDVKITNSKYYANAIHIECDDILFYGYLKYIITNEVPVWILCARTEVRLAFIAGLMDIELSKNSTKSSSDYRGSSDYGDYRDYIQIITNNKKCVLSVQKLLYSCGIESKFNISNDLAYLTIITSHSLVQLNSNPLFLGRFTNESVEELCQLLKDKDNDNNGYHRVKVVSIKRASNDATFDITVDGPNEAIGVHEYYVNGYLSHNTAEIFLFDESDPEVLFAKYGINGLWTAEQLLHHKNLGVKLASLNIKPTWWDDINEIGHGRFHLNHRRMSNNSIAFTKKPSQDMLSVIFDIMKLEGEPGFMNLEEANRRRPNCQGINPCLTGDTIITTSKGSQRIDELIGVKFTVVLYGKEYDSTADGFWKTSSNRQVFKIVLENGKSIKATENHKFLSHSKNWPHDPDGREWKCVSELKVGNSIFCESKNPDSPYLYLASRITSIEAAGFEDVYDCTIPIIHFFIANGIVSHNCGEILLDSYGMCNLTTVNLVQFVNNGTLDLPSLLEAQRLSARCGLRMTLITLELPKWNEIQQRDRLLGTSLTGVKDAMNLLNYSHHQEMELISLLKNAVRDEANRYAAELGVNAPLLTTTVKPEGSLSQLFGGVSSGLHLSHSPYYIRRIRITAVDPLAKTVMELGWPINPEVGTKGATREEQLKNARTLVIDFPVYSGAKKSKYDTDVKEQFDTYFGYQQNYTEHNSSNTITLREHEWSTARDIIYEKWDSFVGVSFLSLDDHSYELSPYEAIDQATYEAMKAAMKPFDMKLLIKNENPEVIDELLTSDCAGGACPIR